MYVAECKCNFCILVIFLIRCKLVSIIKIKTMINIQMYTVQCKHTLYSVAYDIRKYILCEIHPVQSVLLLSTHSVFPPPILLLTVSMHYSHTPTQQINRSSNPYFLFLFLFLVSLCSLHCFNPVPTSYISGDALPWKSVKKVEAEERESGGRCDSMATTFYIYPAWKTRK